MTHIAALARRLFRPLAPNLTGAARPLCTAGSSRPTHTIDDVNSLFAEARLCLQDAVESKGTVYFEDDFKDAQLATEETLSAFDALVDASKPDVRRSLLEANRPKMAQLAEEFRQLEQELIHDD